MNIHPPPPPINAVATALPLIINDMEIEHVTQAKLWGVTITNDLKWNFHIDSIAKKASKDLASIKAGEGTN